MIYLYNILNNVYINYLKNIKNYQIIYSLQNIKYNDIIVICIFLQSEIGRDYYKNSFNKYLYNIVNNNKCEIKQILHKYNNSYLYLFSPFEGRTPGCINGCNIAINQIKDNININENRVIYSPADIYNEDIIYNPAYIGYDWAYIREKINFNELNIVSTNIDNKKKYIIMFNHRASDERLYIFFYLYKYHFNKCNLTYNNFYRGDDISYDIFKKVKEKKCKYYDITLNDYNNIITKCPIKLINESDNINTYPIIQFKKFLEESFIMVTIETNYHFVYNSLQLSEKTYKAIKSGMIFLNFCKLPGVLTYLKNIGFRTYSPFINEEYDNSKYDYHTRLSKFLDEIHRICNLHINDLRKIYEKCIPIINHNINVLKSNKNIPNIKLDQYINNIK